MASKGGEESGVGNCVVLPGDDLYKALTKLGVDDGGVSGDVSIGANGTLVAATASVIRQFGGGSIRIQALRKRYRPRLEDIIVGVVEERSGDFYKVNINASTLATLSVLAFDGATKRNRPNLQKGAIIYCRVVECTPCLEPELTCTAPSGAQKKDWMTGQAVYGELFGGTIVRHSCFLADRLSNELLGTQLQKLGSELPFEVAVGANGLTWIRAADAKSTIIIANSIANMETMNGVEADAMVERLLDGLK